MPLHQVCVATKFNFEGKARERERSVRLQGIRSRCAGTRSSLRSRLQQRHAMLAKAAVLYREHLPVALPSLSSTATLSMHQRLMRTPLLRTAQLLRGRTAGSEMPLRERVSERVRRERSARILLPRSARGVLHSLPPSLRLTY